MHLPLVLARFIPLGLLLSSALPLPAETLSGLDLGRGILEPPYASNTSAYSVALDSDAASLAAYPHRLTADKRIFIQPAASVWREVVTGPTLAAGGHHSLVLRADRSVVAWGSNTDGQTTVPTEALSDVVAVAAGDRHSLALLTDGSVLAWGLDNVGQGDVPVTAQSDVIAIAAGGNQSLALLSNGTVIAWGSISAPAPTDSDIIAIAAGKSHALALRADGSVAAWGSTPDVPTTAVTDVVAIAAGGFRSLALKRDGSVVIWGSGPEALLDAPAAAQGAVAIAATSHHNIVLRADGSVFVWGSHHDPLFDPPAEANRGIIAITAGDNHILALKRDGSLLTWGNNSYNLDEPPPPARQALALPVSAAWPVPYGTGSTALRIQSPPTTTSVTVPVASLRNRTLGASAINSRAVAIHASGAPMAWGGSALPNPAPSGLVAVSTGSEHILAINTDGDLVAWGNDSNGQLHAPSDATDLIAVSAAATHSIALRADGRVITWGQSGIFNHNQVPINARSGVVAIAAGYNFNLALRADGSVVYWGDPDKLAADLPSELSSDVVAIAVGTAYAAALKSDGTPIVWGDPSPYPSTVPPDATGLIAIAMGGDHVLGLRSDGRVVAWGSNGQGQTNVPASAESGVIAIAGSAASSYALKADGSLIAWGAPHTHPTSNLTVPDVATPVVISPGSAHTAHRVPLAAGLSVFYALNTDGTPIRWGSSNPYINPPEDLTGLIALSATENYLLTLDADGAVTGWGQAFYTPVNIPAAAKIGVVAIAAGPNHALALKQNGAVVAWGSNTYGQTNVPNLNPEPGANSHAHVFTAIAASETTSFGLRSDGRVIAWGGSHEGLTTVPVEAQSGVVAITAGRWHALALKHDGTVVAWGDHAHGKTAGVSHGPAVVAMIASDDYSAFLRADGTVLLQGQFHGEVSFESLADVVAFAGGRDSIIMLKADGSVTSQSPFFSEPPANLDVLRPGPPGEAITLATTRAYPDPTLAALTLSSGELTPEFTPATNGYTQTVPTSTAGITLAATAATPGATLQARINGAPWQTLVNGPSLALTPFNADLLGVTANGSVVSNLSHWADHLPAAAQSGVTGIALAQNQAVALKTDGSVISWYPGNPELQPVPAAARSGIAAISTDGSRIFAVTTTGSALAWYPGNNYTNWLPPETQTEVVQVAAKNNSFLALKTDGSVHAWGNLPPPSPEAEAGVASIAVGEGFAFAIKSDGSVVSWGAVPPALADLPADAQTNVSAISLGLTHALALKTDGSIIALGLVDDTPFTAPANASHDAVAIHAGDFFNAVQKADGSVVVWSASGLTWRFPLGLARPRSAPLPLRFGDTRLSLRVTPIGNPLPDSPIATGESRHLAVVDGAVVHARTSLHNWPSPLPPETTSGIVSVYSGNHGEYALKTDGSLLNLSYSGIPQDAQPSQPWETPVRAPIATVAVGYSHALILRTDGTTYAWGSINNIPAAAQTNITAIAAGEYHSIALRRDGRLVAWDNSGNPINTPDQSDFVAIAAAGDRYLALRASGEIVTWNRHDYPEAPPPPEAQSGVVAIAMNKEHRFVIDANGAVIGWGEYSPFHTPPAETSSGVIAITTARNHQIALKADGSLVTWGRGSYGTLLPFAIEAPLVDAPVQDYHLTITRPYPATELAHLAGSNGQTTTPFDPFQNEHAFNATSYPAVSLHGVPFPSHGALSLRSSPDSAFAPRLAGPTISVQSATGAVIQANGSLSAWNISLGQTVTDIQAVAAGSGFVAFLRSDGYVVMSGGTLSGTSQTKAVAIAAGQFHCLMLLPDGTVATAMSGRAPYYLATPHPDAVDIVAISAGTNTSLALRRDGRAVAWGNEADGLTNVPPDALTNVVAISAGHQHHLALRADGRVVAWGSNSHGQTNVPVAATYGIVAISAGYQHSLALKADGSVITWGNSANGLGQVPAAALADIVAIEAGNGSSYAIKSDGSAVTWGPMAQSLTGATLALPLSARLPLAVGANTVELRVTARDDSEAQRTYQLSIPRNPAPELVLVPGTDPSPIHRLIDGAGVHDFGLQQLGVPSSATFTLLNSGSADLVINSAPLGDPGAFWLSGLSLPLTLAAGTQASFEIGFDPETAGPVVSSLQFHANLPHGAPHHATLLGESVFLASEVAAWRQSRFTSDELENPILEATVWGDLADPDGDGLPNLLEYAIGTDPRAPGAAPAALVVDDTEPSARRLMLTYTRQKRASAAGLVYRVEWSDTLAPDSWSELTVEETIASTSDTTETVNASVPANSPRRFLRLRVTAP